MSAELLRGISVVMPVHGDAPYLRLALESSLAQVTQEQLQVLVVLDRVEPVVRQYLGSVADVRLETVEARGEGIVAALNTGIAAARFDLIARMDADDVMMPGRLDVQSRYLREHASVIAVGGQLQFIDDSGKVTGNRRYSVEPDIVRKRMPHRNQLAHPAVMMRRDSVLAIGGYRALFQYGEDYDLWLRLMEHGDLANVGTPVLNYRIHGEQVSRSRRSAMAEATYLAQWAARRRAAGRSESPLLWQAGIEPTKWWVRLDRRRVRTFSHLVELYADARFQGRVPAAVLWAGIAALLRPIEAAYLRWESSQTGHSHG